MNLTLIPDWRRCGAVSPFLLVVALTACVAPSKESTEPGADQQLTGRAVVTTRGDGSDNLPTLSPEIPLEITVSQKPVTLESLQHDFDVFSWQTFIALNWPANADGTPNTNLTIGQNPDGPAVWQSWKESRDIFLPDGSKPPGWNQANSLPEACRTINMPSLDQRLMELTQVGKTPNVLDESEEPFQTGPLIDQNGRYTRFAILTNESMFDYIVSNQLYSASGQAQFDQDADFPASNQKSDTIGAIMIKAAWVRMGGKFDASQYHTRQALVYNNPDEQPGVEPACSLEKVGLVGFHIAHKTQNEPQWVWSTFEHVANAPTQGQAPQRSAYNFFDPDCSDCPVNQPPPRPWDPGTPHTQPTQVERVIPITAATKALNQRYHRALQEAVEGSVWTNYRLVSTQWPTDADSPTDPTGVPAPTFLANTTLETYIQGRVPQTSSNCMGCHNNATDTNGQFSDFTYLLQRAQ